MSRRIYGLYSQPASTLIDLDANVDARPLRRQIFSWDVYPERGSGFANPHLLLRPFIKREAVYSSRIEGTQATLGELLAAEAGAVVDRSPDDLREVGNYVMALEYGVKRLKDLPLSLRLVKELHEKLMKGVRGEIATPGEFRRSQNWIGAPGSTLMNASYVPAPSSELMKCLSE